MHVWLRCYARDEAKAWIWRQQARKLEMQVECCVLCRVRSVIFALVVRDAWGASQQQSDGDSQIVLFVCTGNFYRSRYAELYFNARARPSLGWCAESRGFRLSAANIGPIAACVPERLAAHRLPLPAAMRFPLQIQEQDLVHASRIIALDAVEHRPFVETLFPAWRDQINYWQIPDVGGMRVEEALSAIEREVDALFDQLTTHNMH
jgi:protein-tyrosine phosphatase